MNIGSGNAYPSNALSNFTPHPFTIDGIECNSMEGFLQAMKFKNPDMQAEVCKLIGLKAKFKGKPKKWWIDQKLYWQGVEYDRHSQEYQDLLDRAFNELSKNTGFKKALIASGNSVLTHSMGKTDESKTILTTREFCSRLVKIRNKYFIDLKN